MRRQSGEEKQQKQREKQKQTEQVRTWKHAGGNREKDDWGVGAGTSRREVSRVSIIKLGYISRKRRRLHAITTSKASPAGGKRSPVTLQHPGQHGALKGMGEH